MKDAAPIPATEYRAGLRGLQALLIERVMRVAPPERKPLFDQWRAAFLAGHLDSHHLLQELLAK